MKLFSGTASQKLAEEVAKLLKLPQPNGRGILTNASSELKSAEAENIYPSRRNLTLGKFREGGLKLPLAEAEVVRFGNSEVKVTIKEKVKNQNCLVIQSSSNPTDTNLMELFFFCDALKRQEAKKVIAVVPYFGYAKQNIQHRAGECISVNVVIRFIEAIGFDKIYTFDIHAEATGGVFSIPFKNLSAFPFLAEKLASYFNQAGINRKEIVLVSPDQGAVEKVRNFGRFFYQSENFSQVVIEKQRDQNIIHKARPLGLYGNVKDKITIIVDDMVVSGSTLIPAIDLCLEKGAKDVYAAVIHHDFTSDAPKKIQDSRLIKFFTTNTIALAERQRFEKLEEYSIAPIIAKELSNL